MQNPINSSFPHRIPLIIWFKSLIDEDAEEMLNIINEEFEKVDIDEWQDRP
jgi:hypothetical protein